MIVSLKVKPNSHINKLSRAANGVLSVKITAPPHDGKANEALIKFLAQALGIPKIHITIISGFTHPNKRINIPDAYAAKIAAIEIE